MPDLDDKYSEFSREIGNDEPTQDNAAGAGKEPQPDFSDNADLYAVLCVSKTASSDEIKSAYRRLAKEYHPDVSSDADADEKFKKIQHAYEILFDEVQRAMYDLGGDSMAGLSYEQRLKSVFQGRIVRKDLTKKIKEGANVPVYVLEFLLGQYCSSDDPAIIETGVETVKKILSDNFVRPDEAQKILSLLKMNGSHTIIKSSEWRFPLIFQGFSGYSTKIAPPFNHKNGGTLSTHGRGKCGIYNAQKVFGLIILHLRIDVHSCLAVFMPRKILNCLWINASIQKIGNVGMP